jgi:hypothetical protein
MAGKKKTTFNKLARERKLRERRLEKQARKDARKQNGGLLAESNEIGDEEAESEPVAADAFRGDEPAI